MRKFSVNVDLTDEIIVEFASWLGKQPNTIQEPIDYIATRYWTLFMDDVKNFQKAKAEQYTKAMVEAAVVEAQQKITFVVEPLITTTPDLSGGETIIPDLSGGTTETPTPSSETPTPSSETPVP